MIWTYDSFRHIFNPPLKKNPLKFSFEKSEIEDEKLVAWVCVQQTTGKKFQRELGKGDSVLTLMLNLNKATMREAC